MQRFIPLLAVLLLLAVLAALFGQGLLSGIALGKSVNALLDSAKRGDRAGILAQVSAAQQQSFGAVLERYAPAGYEQSIESLRRVASESAGKDAKIVRVNCRLTSSAGPAVYQAKLLWRRINGRWEWDPAGSYAAPFSTSGEPEWILLGDLMRLAGEEI